MDCRWHVPIWLQGVRNWARQRELSLCSTPYNLPRLQDKNLKAKSLRAEPYEANLKDNRHLAFD